MPNSMQIVVFVTDFIKEYNKASKEDKKKILDSLEKRIEIFNFDDKFRVLEILKSSFSPSLESESNQRPIKKGRLELVINASSTEEFHNVLKQIENRLKDMKKQ